MERVRVGQLADHVRGTRRRARAPEPGGLPLMTSGEIRMGMAPPHPGKFIRIEALEESGLSVAAAARVLGVRRATLSDLVNGNASLSPEMALRVEKAFGLSMDLLLRMQAWHDATRMRARADEIDVRRYQPA
ncbi:MAG: HigA family addiction module antitoxin [Boseongicola sp.]|nr:HigA family addiction module antitoxin [Boseongicola sp.]